MAHGDAREAKWRGKMRMEWVASRLALYVGTRSIHSLSADPHSSTANSRLNWHPRRFKWTRPFRWKTKSGFCACAITFRTCYNEVLNISWINLMFERFIVRKERKASSKSSLFSPSYRGPNQAADMGLTREWFDLKTHVPVTYNWRPLY